MLVNQGEGVGKAKSSTHNRPPRYSRNKVIVVSNLAAIQPDRLSQTAIVPGMETSLYAYFKC